MRSGRALGRAGTLLECEGTSFGRVGESSLGGASFRERVFGLIESAGEKFSKAKEMDASLKRSHGEEEARRLLRRGLEHFKASGGRLVGAKAK